MNPKITAIMVIGLFVGAGALVWFAGGGRLPDPLAIIQGYGGMNAMFTGVTGPYDSESDYLVDKVVTEAYATYDPAGRLYDPTGIKAEIQAAINIVKTEPLDPVSKSTINETAKTNTTETVAVNRVFCDLGLTIRTAGTGLGVLNDIIFTIQVEENSRNIFPGATDSICYILLVETQEAAEVTGWMDVTPASGGYVFPLTTVKTVPVPEWITASGYSGLLSDLKIVSFEVKIENTAPASFLLVKTAEAQAVLDIHIQVLQFGYWKVVKPYTPWVGPPTIDPWKWLSDLFAAIGQFLAVIMGVIVTIVILVKVKRPRLAIVAVVILWVALAFFLGMLDPFLLGLGGAGG